MFLKKENVQSRDVVSNSLSLRLIKPPVNSFSYHCFLNIHKYVHDLRSLIRIYSYCNLCRDI